VDSLTELELWTRDPNGCKRLNGAQTDPPPQEPPKPTGDALHAGDVALTRAGHVLMIRPLGRRAPHRDPERNLAQIMWLQSETGIVYSLFGADDALQAESTLEELRHFERLFDIASIRSAHGKTRFQQRDYDDEFAHDAARFVARDEALDTL